MCHIEFLVTSLKLYEIIRNFVQTFTTLFFKVCTVVHRDEQITQLTGYQQGELMSRICTKEEPSALQALAIASAQSVHAAKPAKLPKRKFDILQPLRQWLDGIEIRTPKMAHFLAKAIPAQCPFERDIKIFGRIIAHIPPLCKLNPLYEQLVGLRFRALCYLVDRCGQDIQSYC